MKLLLVNASIGVRDDGRAYIRLLDGTWKRAPHLDKALRGIRIDEAEPELQLDLMGRIA